MSIDSVFKPNFICPMHNEAKQTKTSEEFGSEKGSLQGNARRRVAPDPKNSELLKGVSRALLKAR